MIVDHLSRIEKVVKEKNRTEVEENFPDERLFQLKFQLPWYADLVNYLAYVRIHLSAKEEVEA